jgi:FXSXX-COOH protein
MIGTEATKQSEYPTDVADLRRVPLAEVPLLSVETLDSTLGRLVRHSPAEPVRVAAFNSAI